VADIVQEANREKREKGELTDFPAVIRFAPHRADFSQGMFMRSADSPDVPAKCIGVCCNLGKKGSRSCCQPQLTRCDVEQHSIQSEGRRPPLATDVRLKSLGVASTCLLQ